MTFYHTKGGKDSGKEILGDQSSRTDKSVLISLCYHMEVCIIIS